MLYYKKLEINKNMFHHDVSEITFLNIILQLNELYEVYFVHVLFSFIPDALYFPNEKSIKGNKFGHCYDVHMFSNSTRILQLDLIHNDILGTFQFNIF